VAIIATEKDADRQTGGPRYLLPLGLATRKLWFTLRIAGGPWA
jgi:hypothetical protein